MADNYPQCDRPELRPEKMPASQPKPQPQPTTGKV